MANKKPITSERWADIRALILDCDGVLTSGEIFYSETGERSLAFFARDGLGLAILCRSGVRCAVLSGRPTDIAEIRHKELGLEAFVGRCLDKAKGIRDLAETLQIPLEKMAFVGDDLADLAPIKLVGLGIAVADADADLKTAADYICSKDGGRGAVREVCENILRAKGVWADLVNQLGSTV